MLDQRITDQIKSAKRQKYEDKLEPIPYLRTILFICAIFAFLLFKYLRYLNKEYHFVEQICNCIYFSCMWANTKLTSFELDFEKLFI